MYCTYTLIQSFPSITVILFASSVGPWLSHWDCLSVVTTFDCLHHTLCGTPTYCWRMCLVFCIYQRKHISWIPDRRTLVMGDKKKEMGTAANIVSTNVQLRNSWLAYKHKWGCQRVCLRTHQLEWTVLPPTQLLFCIKLFYIRIN